MPEKEINVVTITETTARWIISTGIRIMKEAYNSDWNPRNPMFLTRGVANEGETFDTGGFMDDLETADEPLRNWLQGMIQLIRTITSICADQLPADEYLSPDTESESSSVAAAASTMRALFDDDSEKENL